MQQWQTQEAKAKFSDLIRMAEIAPQSVTVRGRPAVVILSQQEYLKLQKPKVNFLKLMQDSPLSDIEIDLERDCSNPRDVLL
jgi:prevent-host-death family protein